MGIDLSPGMIHGVWPGHGRVDRAVMQGDWLQLPFADGASE
jgi:hypothetical protein